MSARETLRLEYGVRYAYRIPNEPPEIIWQDHADPELYSDVKMAWNYDLDRPILKVPEEEYGKDNEDEN